MSNSDDLDVTISEETTLTVENSTSSALTTSVENKEELITEVTEEEMYPHSHQVSIDLSHTHIFTGDSITTSSSGSHTHTFTGTASSHTHTFTGSSATTSSSGSHTHTVSGLYKGTSATYSTNYTSGRVNIEEDGSYTTSSAGSHTHTLTAKGTNASTSITPAGTNASAGSHTHTLTPTGTISDCDLQGTYATSTTGGGQAHNNMPPYILKYVWERVA